MRKKRRSKQDKRVEESGRESFPASDPPASGIPDRPPANADQKWKAAREQKLRKNSRRRATV
jgi:hypothetical protein